MFLCLGNRIYLYKVTFEICCPSKRIESWLKTKKEWSPSFDEIFVPDPVSYKETMVQEKERVDFRITTAQF